MSLGCSTMFWRIQSSAETVQGWIWFGFPLVFFLAGTGRCWELIYPCGRVWQKSSRKSTKFMRRTDATSHHPARSCTNSRLQETTRGRLATQVAGAPAMAQNDCATTRAFLELHKAWMVRSGEPLGLFGTNSSLWFWWKPTSFIHETCQNVCTPSLSNYVKLISAEPQVIDELQKELLAVKKVGSIRDNLAQRHIIYSYDLTDIPQKAPLNDSWWISLLSGCWLSISP